MTTAQELTKNQTLVFNTLSRADGPLSAYTILDQLRGEGFRAPLQVYRALEKLLDYGMVHRLESINAFVACAHPHSHSHNHGMIAFAICEKCGQVSEFSDDVITQRVRQWTTDNAFKPSKTTIEIRGVCASCGTA
ncbi:Fur family transcriptional regulator [Phyllobacterium sp. P30BS-XVII]|uniref:Fur family transcriptional regulator n=1 Tax=Phyllobacterium sp. P30BS-XVII TaxID=2587046 RepID=UPI0015FE5F5E|nr:Fur family transcriptional regulator [Phyllobacterium sp. P30BS-XVII]MBA8900435.1 Fur family zinc uptake transcriptional regulator [Phyllobacterium sp. P30BS-XVII]